MLMTFRQTLQLCKPVREIPTVISLDLQYNGKQASKQESKKAGDENKEIHQEGI